MREAWRERETSGMARQGVSMSAFMVSDNHIAFLVRAFKRYTAPPGSGVTMLSHERMEMARVLKAECARSVRYRYPKGNQPCPACGAIVCDPRVGWDPSPSSNERYLAGRGVPEPCPFAVVPESAFTATATVELTPVIAIKLAQCYQHQSNEHDGWEGSKSREFTDALIGSAIRALDGYEQAPWGIS